MRIGVRILFFGLGLFFWFFDLVFSFSLDKYPEVELLDHMVVLFLIFEAPPHCFPQWIHQVTFLSIVYQGYLFSTTHQFFSFFLILVIAILTGMKWYPSVILTSIVLIICDFVVQSLSCVWFFATPWTAALQAPLSFTVSWSLLKFTSIEYVMLIIRILSTFFPIPVGHLHILLEKCLFRSSGPFF